MKNPKSTTPETQAGTPKEADSKPYDSEAWQDEMALFELRDEARKILPPVSEIAQLAALISHGHPIGLQTWADYAGHAVQLWQASFQKREDWIVQQAYMKLLRTKAEASEAKTNDVRGKVRRPDKFPVTLDEFLKLVLPYERVKNRMIIYRAHLGTGLSPDGYRVIHRNKDEVDALIKMICERQFNEEQFYRCAELLLNYLPRYKAELLQTRAQAAGKASAKKRDEKKAKKKARQNRKRYHKNKQEKFDPFEESRNPAGRFQNI